MKVAGRENAKWGFEPPKDGFHLVTFQEGIKYLEKDGAILTDKNNNKLIVFPVTIKDERDPDNGKNINQIFSENTDWSEQKIADLLVAAGIYKKFEENFPGDVSVFDQQAMDVIKVRLPGCSAALKIETDKKGYQNVVETSSADNKDIVLAYQPDPKAGNTPSAAPKAAAGSSWD